VHHADADELAFAAVLLFRPAFGISIDAIRRGRHLPPHLVVYTLPLEARIRASVGEFARAYESPEPGRRIAGLRRARRK